MVDGLILETTFLVDYEREDLRGGIGPAHSFGERHSGVGLYITATIAGELAAGRSQRIRRDWERFLRPFAVLPLDMSVCWEYGRTYRYLQSNGLLIGANDLWIAAAGVAYEMPVVTRNVREYKRVPGLEVVEYA